ncbi:MULTISPECIES: MptD family putative ECF transporter S component [Brevibacillus]|uniref:Membrane protein n=2 Tax=Brevibacillus TaxID=55080 RepID=A0A4Y3PT13_BREPA|nr:MULTISPECIES: MptD family putative ECF transporter S component [Brevibacillus]MDH6351175.1 energy-coupling factor transport system substrate-specific component [Brevibacillus sp. 1238]GEB35116.1 membrane protein [Brevibacillus parabrevis]
MSHPSGQLADGHHFEEEEGCYMQAQTLAVPNRWTMRDFITLAIFNVIMLIIMTFCPAVSVISPLLVGGLTGLLNGPFYMVMSNKIRKPGALFLTAIITGLYFVGFGYANYMLTLAVIGLIGELILWKKDVSVHSARNAIAYGIFYVGYSLCGVVPLIFFRDSYMAILKKTYSAAAIENMLYYFDTPKMILLMCSISLVGGLLGAYFGHLMLRKHVKKAKLV